MNRITNHMVGEKNVKEIKGLNNYKHPQIFADIYVNKEKMEFNGDLETVFRDIALKFGIELVQKK